MIHLRKLVRSLNRLIRRLDLDDIPIAALLFLGGCLILALIGFFSWRSDRALLANGREIRAEVIDRRIKEDVDCDSDDFSNNCTTDYSYFITYRYHVNDEEYSEEQVVDNGIYERTESTILIRYLPDRPSVSNVAEIVENTTSIPLFSLITILVGLLGAAVIFWFQS